MVRDDEDIHPIGLSENGTLRIGQGDSPDASGGQRRLR